MEKEEAYSQEIAILSNELLLIKKRQRMVEEKLIEVLEKPIYRQWMDERVQAQYKHDRILNEMVGELPGVSIARKQKQEDVKEIIMLENELFDKLYDVEQNILFIQDMMYRTQDFSTYKLLNNIISDEYIYHNRLGIMINGV